MKYFILFFILTLAGTAFSQSVFPDFLQGTWKMENKEIYEHWDRLNDNSLRGFSYQMKNGKMTVSEYLDITRTGSEMIYTASVLSQNQGKGIPFRLARADSIYVFENPGHDFPQKIAYQKLSGNEIFVQVSDGKQKGFSYRMKNINRSEKDTTALNPDYDKALAEKLGGDDYGMKSYFFVILKTGTNTTADRQFISESFRGHLDNINQLAEEGRFAAAGPLGQNENHYRGIFILNNIHTLEEAEELLLTDPAIKNSLLDYQIFTWYGSAALPEYLPFADKIWKLKP